MGKNNELHIANDIWNLNASSPPNHSHSAEPLPSFMKVSELEPLDLQIGALSKKTVPPTLADVLFDKVTSSPEHQSVSTYAILDSAKIPGLPELFGATESSYRCLFKDTAYRDLGDVAPWIITLNEGDSLVRKLFTDEDPPCGFWQLEAGIFLRSEKSLDQLWAHLRRFTRLRDADSSWFYFRFWEPEVMRAFARHAELLSNFWSTFLPNGKIIVTDPLLNEALVISSSTEDRDEQHSSIRLTKEMKAVLRQQRIRMFSRKLARETIAKTLEPAAECLKLIDDAIMEGIAIGLQQDNHLRKFVQLCQNADSQIPGWRRSATIVHCFAAGHSPARLLTELEYDLDALGREIKNG